LTDLLTGYPLDIQMQTRTYQLWTNAIQANAANVSILAPGYIHGICWSNYIDSTLDNSNLLAELSFQSTGQQGTHNALGVIDTFAAWQNMGAAGMVPAGYNKVCMGMYIPVGIGQIIYLNTSGTAGSTCRVLIQILEK